MGTRSEQEINNIIKESITEFFNDNDFITQLTKNLMESLEQKMCDLQLEIKKQNDKISILEQKVDSMEQNSKSNNICIYGVSEIEEENAKSKIIEILKNNANLALKNEEIISCYRVGKQPSSQFRPRPLILKVSSEAVEVNIFKSAKKQKSSKVYFTEDLTLYRRLLMKSALEGKPVFNGQIYTKVNKKKG